MIIAIIPARLSSKRFYGKVLKPILGTPMLDWVYKAVSTNKLIQKTVVATCDQQIMDHCSKNGFNVLSTGEHHQSGSDRIYEAATKLKLKDDDIVVNIQSDEPCITEHEIFKIVDPLLRYMEVETSTIATPIAGSMATNPNRVKVVLNNKCNALYFSRSVIPYKADPFKRGNILCHIGAYGFKMYALREFKSYARSDLEDTEGLEQLRILENCGEIRVSILDYDGVSVDEPGDIERAEEILLKNKRVKEALNENKN